MKIEVMNFLTSMFNTCEVWLSIDLKRKMTLLVIPNSDMWMQRHIVVNNVHLTNMNPTVLKVQAGTEVKYTIQEKEKIEKCVS